MTGDADSAPGSCRSSPTGARSSRVGRGQRYKTELCRQYEENGKCFYGTRCQFAHGPAELRTVARHPKYKTNLCRTFHSTGLCPYGTRCHFIHNNDDDIRHKSAAAAAVAVAVGLEALLAPLINAGAGIEFDVQQHLLGLLLSALDPAIIRHHLYQPHFGTDVQPSTSFSGEACALADISWRTSCGSVASSTSPSADILNWTSVE